MVSNQIAAGMGATDLHVLQPVFTFGLRALVFLTGGDGLSPIITARGEMEILDIVVMRR